jgi:hypothetical protein
MAGFVDATDPAGLRMKVCPNCIEGYLILYHQDRVPTTVLLMDSGREIQIIEKPEEIGLPEIPLSR